MGVKATTIAVWALISFTAVTPVLGGLYLYMNRFEYLNVGVAQVFGSQNSPAYLRINKLTGERCISTGAKLRHRAPWVCGVPYKR
jgi:hypothetical protein